MKIKKIGIIFLLLLLISLPVGAVENLTLEAAIERAKSENMNLQLAEINYQKAEIEMKNLELQNEYNYTKTQKLQINKNY